MSFKDMLWKLDKAFYLSLGNSPRKWSYIVGYRSGPKARSQEKRNYYQHLYDLNLRRFINSLFILRFMGGDHGPLGVIYFNKPYSLGSVNK